MGGGACVGLAVLNRALVQDETAPAAPAAEPASAPRADASDYRLDPFTGDSAPSSPRRPPVPVRPAAARTLRGTGRRIALTFDDGPHPTHTPEILRILRQYDTRATFFVIGENAFSHPTLVHAIAEDGHLLANHSWSHPQLDLIPATQVRTELGRTCDLLERLLGAPPRWARAPYGAWDRPSLEICAELAMEPLGWSIDTDDWTRPGQEAISQAVLRGAHSGGVVLTHDGGGDRSQTVAALRFYLPRLLDRGYTMVQPA